MIFQAVALTEAKLKMGDIPAALQICSLMHQRYAEFVPCLMENWNKVLLTKKDEKVCLRKTRRYSNINLATVFIYCKFLTHVNYI